MTFRELDFHAAKSSDCSAASLTISRPPERSHAPAGVFPGARLPNRELLYPSETGLLGKCGARTSRLLFPLSCEMNFGRAVDCHVIFLGQPMQSGEFGRRPNLGFSRHARCNRWLGLHQQQLYR